MGADNSLLLLAIKRLMGSGDMKGDKFETFHSVTGLEHYEIGIQDLPEFINIFADDCAHRISGLQSEKQSMINFLRFESDLIKNIKTLPNDFRDSSINSIYDKGSGMFYIFSYVFRKLNSDTVSCETIEVSVRYKLADLIIVLTRVSRCLFWSSSSQEYRRIPPAYSYSNVINALMIAASPLLSSPSAPKSLVNDLKDAARNTPDFVPNDNHRRKVIDPITKMKVVVTDPAILRLLPTKWEYVSSNDIKYGFRRHRIPFDWKFEH